MGEVKPIDELQERIDVLFRRSWQGDNGDVYSFAPSNNATGDGRTWRCIRKCGAKANANTFEVRQDADGIIWWPAKIFFFRPGACCFVVAVVVIFVVWRC
ncbi:unnamed protein product, partial [Polarella glacialis]